MKNTAIDQARKHQQWNEYCCILAEDGHDSLDATCFAFDRLFNGIDFDGKRVLEIGSGKGLMSLFACISGAKDVISLEPELDGSRSQVSQIQRERALELGLHNVKVLKADFNEWQNEDEQFDIVMCLSTVNHLHESPYNANSNKNTFLSYLEIAEKIRSMLRPSGVAIITDACRYGIFWFLKKYGFKPPWSEKPVSIDWRIHQNPRTWKRIFLSSGFPEVNIFYPLPYRLRHYKYLVANPIVNYFLLSSFCLHCHNTST